MERLSAELGWEAKTHPSAECLCGPQIHAVISQFLSVFLSCFHQITTGVAVSIILSCVLFSSAGQMSIDSLMTESSLENQRDKGTQSKAADWADRARSQNEFSAKQG